MPARDKKNYVKPRKLSKSTRDHVEYDSRPAARPRAEGPFWRASPRQLRAIAACLRTGEQAERNDLAGQLEARAEGLPQRAPQGRPRQVEITITQGRKVWRGDRHDAAAQLGLSVATLDVQLSRHGGRWVRNAGGAKTMLISRGKRTES